MNPNLVALNAYSGKYEQMLMLQLFKELDLLADGIQIIPNVKNDLTLTKLTIGRGLKPYTGTFVSGDNQLIYAPRVLHVEKAQRDIVIDPEKYRTNWMAELRGVSESNANKKIPFADFTWGAIMKENAQEIVEMLYAGVGKTAFAAYAAGTVYNPGALISFNATVNGKTETQYYKCVTLTTAGQSPATNPEKWQWAGNLALNKGYGALITDAINNEGFNHIVNTGAIDSDSAYDQFTSVWRKIPEPQQLKGAVIYCSVNNYQLLLDDFENKIKKYFDIVDGITYLAKTNNKCQIKPVSWLSGSGRLIGTPLNNLVLGTDDMNDMNQITNVPQHYTLESSMTFVIGTQIRDLEPLVINDQA